MGGNSRFTKGLVAINSWWLIAMLTAATLVAGATPYLRATQSADLPVMRLLLAHGADPTLQTANHTTGLMLAAGVGFDEGTSHARRKMFRKP